MFKKEAFIAEVKSKMEKSIEALRKDLSRIRTGRASLTLLDGVRVNYYGVPTPLSQVASLSVPESRTISIQPWDPKIIGEIEKERKTQDPRNNRSLAGTVNIPIRKNGSVKTKSF